MTVSKTAERLLSAFLSLAVMIAAFAGFSVRASAKSKWDGYTKISSAADLLKMKNSSDKFYLEKLQKGRSVRGIRLRRNVDDQ